MRIVRAHLGGEIADRAASLASAGRLDLDVPDPDFGHPPRGSAGGNGQHVIADSVRALHCIWTILLLYRLVRPALWPALIAETVGIAMIPYAG